MNCRIPADVGVADDLTGVIDGDGATGREPQVTQIVQARIVVEEGMIPAGDRSLADDLARVVDVALPRSSPGQRAQFGDVVSGRTAWDGSRSRREEEHEGRRA